MRLFLWFIPYCCIIPALAIHYIIQNFSLLSSKFFSVILSLFFFYFFYNFILITPYQYTYLNTFNGKNEKKYQKFENDYWGVSINELIKKIDFEKDKPIKFSTCGVNHAIAKRYLTKSGYKNIQFSSPEESDYIIMTNRALEFNGFSNCFDRYSGKDMFKVTRNNLSLSLIRKIN
jgi:hypothetical protein